MAQKQISVLGNMRIAGALVLDQDNTDFPLNPRLGTLLIKGQSLFAYLSIGNVQTWFPLFQSLSNSYLHTQAIAANKWTVNHNLDSDKYWYQIQDGDGNIIGEVSRDTVSNNAFELHFSEPITGTCIAVGMNSVALNNISASILEVGGNVVINSSGIYIGGHQVLTADQANASIVDAETARAEAAEASLLATLTSVSNTVSALQTLTASNDVNLDTVQEIVSFVKTDASLLDGLTSGKVNVADILDVLTSTATNKPLSAAQGKVLNDLITALTTAVAAKATTAYVDQVKVKTIALTGEVTGSATADANGNVSIATTVKGDTVSVLNTISGATALNYNAGSYVSMTIGAATTLSLTGIPDSTKAYGFTLEITNGGTSVTWPGGITWLSGVVPSLKASGVNLVTLITRNGGASWLGSST